MAKGNYAAYQQAKPIEFDPSKGVGEAIDRSLAIKTSQLNEKKYEDARMDLYNAQWASTLTDLDNLTQSKSNEKFIDEHLYEFAYETKQKVFALKDKYGDKLFSDPNAKAELETLLSSAKYLHSASKTAGEIIQVASVGMSPSTDDKGKIMPPKYNLYNEKYIDLTRKIGKGEFKIDYVKGRPVAYLLDEEGGVIKNDDGSDGAIDLLDFVETNLNLLSNYEDYDAYLGDFIDKRLGSYTETLDKGTNTIKTKKFSQIASKVKAEIKKDIGPYGRLTDLGKTFLANEVGLTWQQIDSLSKEDYDEAVLAIVESIGMAYDEEYSKTVNTALINANINQQRANAYERQVNANVRKINNEIDDNGTGAKGIVELEDGTEAVTYSLDKPTVIETTNSVGDKTKKTYSNLVIGADGRISLSDGFNTMEISAEGAASQVKKIGYNDVKTALESSKEVIENNQSNLVPRSEALKPKSTPEATPTPEATGTPKAKNTLEFLNK